MQDDQIHREPIHKLLKLSPEESPSCERNSSDISPKKQTTHQSLLRRSQAEKLKKFRRIGTERMFATLESPR
ncbi:hypothetical protein RvY_16765 [Ramazzottius varieornatus]|uniref:Uncharacterized protein n=1 Tax=Ramazzottius varieornatus TaxID=947166 RepID=A0A1D1W5W9_RAMVA|nr:hypothetical protein RvY_16765 [Ramazzottius varieornatus]